VTSAKDAAPVEITGARVLAASGAVAATIDLLEIGGGTQTVTVDGVPEERVHPRSSLFSVRLISPDRMVPDTLREVDSYEDASDLARKYAAKLDEHADRVADLAKDLQV
jgi:hypothetical protein